MIKEKVDYESELTSDGSFWCFRVKKAQKVQHSVKSVGIRQIFS